MEARIRSDDKLRLIGDCDQMNFVDVRQVGSDGIAIDMFPLFHYIEIREKDSQMRIFAFKRKSDKKSYDFGWWEDASVTFSVNRQVMNK